MDRAQLRRALEGVTPPEPVDPLPAGARAKLEGLRSDLAAARGEGQALGQRMNELERTQKYKARHLKRLLAPKGEFTDEGEGLGLNENAGEVQVTKIALSAAQSEVSTLLPRLSDARERFEALAQIVRRCDEFVEDNQKANFRDRSVPAPKVSGAALADAVETKQRRIRELASDIRTAECAPLPKDEAKRVIRSQLNELAAQGFPNLAPVIEGRGLPIDWPTHYSSGELLVLPLIVALCRGQIIAEFDKVIDENWDDTHALSDAARDKRIAELKRDLLATEREEEVLVALATASGLPVLRRSEANILAVLGIEQAR